MLLKQPGFSLIAILTRMLGIGATSAVFSLVEGALLTPPPAGPRDWAAEQWVDWARQGRSFETIAG